MVVVVVVAAAVVVVVGGASLKNWSNQSACTAVANEVATILVIFLTYFSPVVTHSPRKICRRCLEFCMHS